MEKLQENLFEETSEQMFPKNRVLFSYMPLYTELHVSDNRKCDMVNM